MKSGIAYKWAKWVVENPWISIIGGIVLSLALGMGGKNIKFSTDYRYFFAEENPQRIAFDNIQETYSNDDSVLFAISPKNGKVFDKTTLQAVAYLTKESWKLPFSTRVDSITNFQYSRAQADDLIVTDLVTEEELEQGLSEEQFENIKSIAINEPLLINRLITDKANVTGVNVTMSFPLESPFEVPQAVAAARELAKKFEQKFPDQQLNMSGLVMMNNAFNEASMNDMQSLTPLMYVVILVLMAVMLKTVTGVLATFAIIILSIMSAMGFAGWMGFPLTPPSATAPTIITTLAIADSIHVLKSILVYMSEGMKKKDAIIEGLRVNFRPVFLTSFTTAIGFLSLNFSDTPPFHDLGNITALGVMMAFLLSVTFLPAAVSLLPMSAKVQDKGENSISYRYAGWVRRNGTKLIWITVAVVAFLGFQIPKIKLNDQFVKYFDESMDFRTSSDYVMKNLSGIYNFNFDLKTGESQGITDPAYLQHVENFSNYLRTIPGVTHVNTMTDTFKRLNKNMHADDQTYYKLPDNRELASQYLLLYEMSLPYGLDLNNQVDVDKSSSRVIVTVGNIESSQALDIATTAENWLKENTPENFHTKATSPFIMFAHISNNNVTAMFWGTLFAFSLITIIMIFSLGSIKYGLISLFPNLIPASMAFGIWSLGVGEAGFAISIVGSVTLGIVVDDTVHFLSKYAQAKKEKGLNSDEAIRYAFKNVGAALVITSIILTIGFAILMMSSFKLNFVLGALSALTIAVALLVDFTFLPALLDFMDREKSAQES